MKFGTKEVKVLGKTIWHYINSGKCTASYNMALDEALLEWHSKGDIGPVLRFYEWSPATLSIGYFQSVSTEIVMDLVASYGLGFVRIALGGGAVMQVVSCTDRLIESDAYRYMPDNFPDAIRLISCAL